MTELLLSFRLAFLVTAILLVLATPLAYWLAFSKVRAKFLIEAVVALPLVLPPTVLGFYLLIAMGPRGPLGKLWLALFGHTLAFTFTGLVIASVFYSLPFCVQPLVASFERIDPKLLDASRVLGARNSRTFRKIVLPLSLPGVITAVVLTFAHTLGEFGVVLMIGGSIPGITRVASIALYDEVQALAYPQAHVFSATLLGISFVLLLAVTFLQRRRA